MPSDHESNEFNRGIEWLHKHKQCSNGTIPFFRIRSIDKNNQSVTIIFSSETLATAEKDKLEKSTTETDGISQNCCSDCCNGSGQKSGTIRVVLLSDCAMPVGWIAVEEPAKCIEVENTKEYHRKAANKNDNGLQKPACQSAFSSCFCSIEELFLRMFPQSSKWHADDLIEKLNPLIDDKET